MTKTIVVCGATGQLGGSVARRMMLEGWIVRAITRNKDSHAAKLLTAKGAKLTNADYDDSASLVKAFEASRKPHHSCRPRKITDPTITTTGRTCDLCCDQFLGAYHRTWRPGRRRAGVCSIAEHRKCCTADDDFGAPSLARSTCRRKARG